jgi:hypothetical protein
LNDGADYGRKSIPSYVIGPCINLITRQLLFSFLRMKVCPRKAIGAPPTHVLQMACLPSRAIKTLNDIDGKSEMSILPGLCVHILSSRFQIREEHLS